MKRSFDKFTQRLEAIGLHGQIQERAVKLHVSLRDLYEGPRAPSIVRARRAVYVWLIKQGKGVNEVARIFDRTPSTISNLKKKRN